MLCHISHISVKCECSQPLNHSLEDSPSYRLAAQAWPKKYVQLMERKIGDFKVRVSPWEMGERRGSVVNGYQTDGGDGGYGG